MKIIASTAPATAGYFFANKHNDERDVQVFYGPFDSATEADHFGEAHGTPVTLFFGDEKRDFVEIQGGVFHVPGRASYNGVQYAVVKRALREKLGV